MMIGDATKELSQIESMRAEALKLVSAHHRAQKGQYFTPVNVARFMNSMFTAQQPSLRILDAGAGAGILFASCVVELCSRTPHPKVIEVTAYESEGHFIEYLNRTMEFCEILCRTQGIEFRGKVIHGDFIRLTVESLRDDIFAHAPGSFNLAILNPPYKKIACHSDIRSYLDMVHLEATNLYSAFVWLAAIILEPGGELVAITPRSFCNGPYFRHFRKFFLHTMQLDRIHVFESRDRLFQDDGVLQENVIVHATKFKISHGNVLISSSKDPEQGIHSKILAYEQIVHPGDKDFFIHIPSESQAEDVSRKMASLQTSVQDLGLSVSTGRVVDYRAKVFLRDTPGRNTSPLIYPTHFSHGYVEWPKFNGRKPNALELSPETDALLVPSGYYVLARRFSAKEESRRIVAAIHDPQRVPAKRIGFENHLNYFHEEGKGLNPELAKGLAVYLNSSLVDLFFRQFNGHTQVNATDLRKIKYPSRCDLIKLGAYVTDVFPEQDEIDKIVEREIFSHAQEEILSQSHS